DGEYWVFLEVNEGSYGGRPASDGPDSIDSLMANTRNNPLEDLAVHLPMICDRYELRDDVMPGAGRFRGGIGVVKKQRILTDGFITHECDRHEDVPWGIFGGGEGQCGAVEIYNAARPDDVTDMPAKFAGLRVSSGDVMAFYGPCGGGYGDPLDRPAEKVLEDVLDDFCTVAHAREAYGVVVDLETETVDVAATEALRSRMRADPRRGDSGSAAVDRRGADARQEMRTPLAASGVDRPAAAGSGERGASVPAGSVASRATPPPAASPAGRPSIEDLVARLNERLGDDWSFDVQRHHRNGGGIEVTAEMKSNGARVQCTGTSNGNGSLPLGAQIEIASEAAFRSCAEEMLGAGSRVSV
ncbi:MAG: hydantoinase B/oxoprolinase family protein, partial [Gammaproteobacteria bacterium]|nr:hydantoinase B/oxoprolinase family protein [Gammaproteobacteria bacterium]